MPVEGDGRPIEEDWRRSVVYQVWPRSFADSSGDGVGDLRGVLARLDHLERLGVDVVCPTRPPTDLVLRAWESLVWRRTR
jgi:hypothetical protein